MQQFQEMNEYGEISAATLFKTVHSNDEGSSAPPTPTTDISTAHAIWIVLGLISLVILTVSLFMDMPWITGITLALTTLFALAAGACEKDNK